MTLVAGVFVGPALAGVIGPYAVIIIAALAGASWALSDETATNTTSALWFLLRITITAAVLTSVVVALLERYLLPGGNEASRWLIAPVAFGIGWVGRDWPTLLRWLGSLLSRIAAARYKPPPSDKGGDDGRP